jgi:protein TonB
MSNPIPMTANEATMPGAGGDPKSDNGAIVSAGWLGAQSIFDHPDDRKIGRAMATSLLVHGGAFALILFVFAVGPAQILTKSDPLEYKVVFLETPPGPGGGGGGSPAPAPPKPVEIPPHQAPTTIPVAVPAPVDPPPSLVAPIQTNTSALLQASGTSSISLAAWGGGGSGGGIGSGKGNGVGEGTGGGFGGGAYAPGNGVSWPSVLREVKPKYTPDAMRAKLQGAVELEIIVLEDGTVGDVRVTKSLDRASGLDDAAIAAAKQWKFTPGMKDGKPVATRVLMTLEFRLH